MVLACLIHDLSLNLMRTEQVTASGGAQLFAPYVSERR